MSIFVPFENNTCQGDDALICLADRFNWFAFFLPPIWAISRSLWLVLAGMILVVFAGSFLSAFFDLPFASLYFLGIMWLGFSANDLYGNKLVKQGWQEKSYLLAPNLMQAERRFFGRARRFNRVQKQSS